MHAVCVYSLCVNMTFARREKEKNIKSTQWKKKKIICGLVIDVCPVWVKRFFDNFSFFFIKQLIWAPDRFVLHKMEYLGSYCAIVCISVTPRGLIQRRRLAATIMSQTPQSALYHIANCPLYHTGAARSLTAMLNHTVLSPTPCCITHCEVLKFVFAGIS